MYATREPGSFIAWVFLVPMALCGVILVAGGKLAKAIRK
jgi:hypothetical protein